jgi:hypothetical protein
MIIIKAGTLFEWRWRIQGQADMCEYVIDEVEV